MIPERDKALENELARQQQHERLRAQFAQLANLAGPWLERSLDAVHSILTASCVPLEDQLNRLNKLEEEMNAWRQSMVELERCSQVSRDYRHGDVNYI
ncbi:unnamed protein product [Protopolystoma xenopodis]|uniref:Uncharacterized protein n=1 Tax=Protopolystoma xenopodis TaxID=117903 RepID=A0A448WAQ2_9PLAT|nr:unnamed protein product [Protopolystoma xenopodis]